MKERPHYQPDHAHTPREAGEETRAVPKPQPEPETPPGAFTFRMANGNVFEISLPPSVSATHNPSSGEKPHKSTLSAQQTVQPRTIFENCILRDLRPSPAEMDRRLAAGKISEEQAAKEKRKVLLMERAMILGQRVAQIRRMFEEGGIPAAEKRALRGEYKSLRKDIHRIREEQWGDYDL